MTDEQLLILMAFLGACAAGKDLHQEGVGAEFYDAAARFKAIADKRGAEVVVDGIDVKPVAAALVKS